VHKLLAKITGMEDKRLSSKACKMLYKHDYKSKHAWVSKICTCLCQHGCGFVWDNRGVENVNTFIKYVKRRIVDCRWQEWNGHIQNRDRFFHRFCLYATFQTSFRYTLIEMNCTHDQNLDVAYQDIAVHTICRKRQ